MIKSVYPGKSWSAKEPEEVRMDSAGLDVLKEHVGGRGCVVRYGYMVYSWGDIGRRTDVASAAKAVYSHFLFKAVEDEMVTQEQSAFSQSRFGSLVRKGLCLCDTI